MKKDNAILEQLRKSSMKSLGEMEYLMIKEEVAKKGIKGLTGYAKSIVTKAMREQAIVMEKASKLKNGDMVSWNSSGGQAQGRIEHIMREGVLGIPESSFKVNATEDDPAVLIRIFKDGEETETLVGHKASTLRRVSKHLGNQHDQKAHGTWNSFDEDDSEGENDIEPKNNRQKKPLKDDSEGEYGD